MTFGLAVRADADACSICAFASARDLSEHARPSSGDSTPFAGDFPTRKAQYCFGLTGCSRASAATGPDTIITAATSRATPMRRKPRLDLTVPTFRSNLPLSEEIGQSRHPIWIGYSESPPRLDSRQDCGQSSTAGRTFAGRTSAGPVRIPGAGSSNRLFVTLHATSRRSVVR